MMVSCSDPVINRASSVIITDKMDYREINDILPDKDGYVWIATNGGLFQYNGHNYYHFVSTKDSTSICSNAVLKVYQTLKGRILVLTDFGACISESNTSFKTIISHGVYPSCRKVMETATGRLFIHVNDQDAALYIYDDSDTQAHKWVQGEFPEMDAMDNIWIWNRSANRLECYDGKSLHMLKSLEFTYNIYSSCSLPNGQIAYFTSSGIVLVDSGKSTVVSHLSGMDDAMKGLRVVDARQLNDSLVSLYSESDETMLWNVNNNTMIGAGDASFSYSIPHTDAKVMVEDLKGNLWIGTKHHGYSVEKPKEVPTRLRNFQDLFVNQEVTHLCEATDGGFYLLSGHKEVFFVDSSFSVTKVLLDPILKDSQLNQLKVDGKGNLWIVSNHHIVKGVVHGNKYIIERQFPYFTYTIGEDSYGNMWWESLHTLYCLKYGADIPIRVEDNFDLVNAIVPNGEHGIVVSTYGGEIFGVDSKTFQTKKIDIDFDSRHSVFLRDMVNGNDSTVWVASSDRGILRLNTTTWQYQLFYDERLCNQIVSIMPDEDGELWIGTLNGLIRCSPHSGIFAQVSTKSEEASRQFVPMSRVRLSSNDILMGMVDGIETIDTGSETCNNLHCPRIDFIVESRGMQSAYEEKKDTAVSSKTRAEISYAKIRMRSGNSGVGIYFSTFDNNESSFSTHALLDGFDTEWRVLHDNYAYYSHIPSGNYTLRLRFSDSRSGEEMRLSLPISVEYPLWRNPWMLFVVYPIIILLLSFAIYHYARIISRQRLKAKEATRLYEEEKRQNEQNLIYFTNVSHEFRTPLTMINGALKMLGSDKSNDASLLSLARQNSQRLLFLVNQLLNFEKMRNGKLQPANEAVDLVRLINQVATRHDLGEDVGKSHIHLETDPNEHLFIEGDTDMIDKVFTNLISNALKYTEGVPDVTVSIREAHREEVSALFGSPVPENPEYWVYAEVSDKGIGVRANEAEKVFDLFFKSRDARTSEVEGTGIGLYYTKKIVESHHGKIACRPNADGAGSVFFLAFPRLDLSADEAAKISSEGVIDKALPALPPVPPKVNKLHTDFKIMIVDDDESMLKFLALLLGQYDVISFNNAHDAWRMMVGKAPDMLISDVRMNGLSGYDLCKKVKNDRTFCHLPVILLSALSTSDQQISGLDAGADAYVTKPFDPQYLLSLIKSIIENRQRIHRRVALANAQNIEGDDIPDADSEFLKTLFQYMEEHSSDTEINIDELTGIIGMGRSKLFYKTKALTGMSPNNFFKTYKLNKAAKMILDSSYKLTYIADILGFSSQSHFTAAFKSQFGCLPSKYKEMNKTVGKTDENRGM